MELEKHYNSNTIAHQMGDHDILPVVFLFDRQICFYI